MRDVSFRSGKSSENLRVDESALRDLKKLISAGENLHLEFKAKANHPDKLARSMCAFANSSGGVLLLGVNDDGAVSGVRYPDEDIHAIIRILKTARPFVKFRYSIIPVSEKKSVVRFEIQENRRKPATLRMDNGKVFIRSADECLQAGPVLKAVLKIRSSPRGSLISFGDEEKMILGLFQDGSLLTFKKISTATGIPSGKLMDKLSVLVAAGILHLRPGDPDESFKMNLA